MKEKQRQVDLVISLSMEHIQRMMFSEKDHELKRKYLNVYFQNSLFLTTTLN